MKCPKCQFDNPPAMKFCGQCGDKLEVTDPNLSVKSDSDRPKQDSALGVVGLIVAAMTYGLLKMTFPNLGNIVVVVLAFFVGVFADALLKEVGGRIKIVVFALFAVVLLAGWYWAAQTKWKEFRSKAGGFVVLMPGTPTEKKQSFDTEDGPLILYTFEVKLSDSGYVVGYSDYPAEVVQKSDPAKMLDDGRDGAVEIVNGKLRSEKNISLNGSPGREIIIDYASEVIAKSRAYLVKNRLYSVTAITLKGLESSNEVQKFLNSFRLTE